MSPDLKTSSRIQPLGSAGHSCLLLVPSFFMFTESSTDPDNYILMDNVNINIEWALLISSRLYQDTCSVYLLILCAAAVTVTIIFRSS